MEFTDLSLGLKQWVDGESSQSEITIRNREVQRNFDDLQLQIPLPSDWEQCLDLQSGRMYYVNRKTSMKIWDSRPDHEEHKIDLELNNNNVHGCISLFKLSSNSCYTF